MVYTIKLFQSAKAITRKERACKHFFLYIITPTDISVGEPQDLSYADPNTFILFYTLPKSLNTTPQPLNQQGQEKLGRKKIYFSVTIFFNCFQFQFRALCVHLPQSVTDTMISKHIEYTHRHHHLLHLFMDINSRINVSIIVYT